MHLLLRVSFISHGKLKYTSARLEFGVALEMAVEEKQMGGLAPYVF